MSGEALPMSPNKRKLITKIPLIYKAIFFGYFIFAIFNLLGIADNDYVRTVLQIILVVVVSVFYIRQVWKRDCRWAYIIAYVFRLGLLLFSVYGRRFGMLPFDGSDTEYFYSGVFERRDHISYGNDSLVTLTVWLSYLLGDARLIYQYIMLLIAMAGIRATDRILQLLGINKNIKYIILVITAIFPYFAMSGVIYTREAVVSSGVAISLLLVILYLKETESRSRYVYLFMGIGLLMIVSLFHAAPIALIPGYLIFILLYDFKADRVIISRKSLVLCLSIAILLCAIVFIAFKINPFAFEKLRGISDVKTIARRFMFDSNLEAGSSYAQYVGDSDTWGRLILYTPARLFYGMFAPLPWEWRGIADAITFFLNSLFYMVVYFVAIVDVFRKKYWKNFNKLFFVMLICSSVMVGWGSVAFGTAIRHRDKFFLLFVILMALELRGKDKGLLIENTDSKC